MRLYRLCSRATKEVSGKIQCAVSTEEESVSTDAEYRADLESLGGSEFG